MQSSHLGIPINLSSRSIFLIRAELIQSYAKWHLRQGLNCRLSEKKDEKVGPKGSEVYDAFTIADSHTWINNKTGKREDYDVVYFSDLFFDPFSRSIYIAISCIMHWAPTRFFGWGGLARLLAKKIIYPGVNL